jgi:hypothetical protein
MNNTHLSRIAGITLLFAIAATSCSKKSSDTNPEPTAPSGDSATVSYRVTSSNRSSGIINWTSAVGAGKQIAFKGNTSSRVELYKYNFNTSNFFSSGYELTTMRVPSGTYTNAEFNYQMIPSRDPALQLVGSYTAGGTTTPVKVNIDQFVEVATKLPTATFASGKTYAATINLDMAAITNGLTATHLANATRTNGEIVIAYYSNPSLLQIFINNINNVVQHQVTLSE